MKRAHSPIDLNTEMKLYGFTSHYNRYTGPELRTVPAHERKRRIGSRTSTGTVWL